MLVRDKWSHSCTLLRRWRAKLVPVPGTCYDVMRAQQPCSPGLCGSHVLLSWEGGRLFVEALSTNEW